jgi:hypothetical protein
MTYHKDESIVVTYQGLANSFAKNCGWLSYKRKFPTGDNRTSNASLKSLADKSRSAMTLGHHTCEFCGWEDLDYGNGEVWIKFKKTYWRMPRMIWHYTEVHNYKLPLDVDTVLSLEAYKLIDFEFGENSIEEKLVNFPRYEVTAYWNESRFPDLISFNREVEAAGW